MFFNGISDFAVWAILKWVILEWASLEWATLHRHHFFAMCRCFRVRYNKSCDQSLPPFLSETSYTFGTYTRLPLLQLLEDGGTLWYIRTTYVRCRKYSVENESLPFYFVGDNRNNEYIFMDLNAQLGGIECLFVTDLLFLKLMTLVGRGQKYNFLAQRAFLGKLFTPTKYLLCTVKFWLREGVCLWTPLPYLPKIQPPPDRWKVDPPPMVWLLAHVGPWETIYRDKGGGEGSTINCPAGRGKEDSDFALRA